MAKGIGCERRMEKITRWGTS